MWTSTNVDRALHKKNVNPKRRHSSHVEGAAGWLTTLSPFNTGRITVSLFNTGMIDRINCTKQGYVVTEEAMFNSRVQIF